MFFYWNNTLKKNFDPTEFMKLAHGFYLMGCNKFKINGTPHMTAKENKILFGVNGFNFQIMSIEMILEKFKQLKNTVFWFFKDWKDVYIN